MKYNFQRGKGSSWWAWWKSDKSFTQGFHFSIRLWETVTETTQLSPLAIHRRALHKPLIPPLREGPITTLFSCCEKGKGKTADGEAVYSYPKNKRHSSCWGEKGKKEMSKGRRKQTNVNFFSFSPYLYMAVLTQGCWEITHYGRAKGTVLDQEWKAWVLVLHLLSVAGGSLVTSSWPSRPQL